MVILSSQGMNQSITRMNTNEDQSPRNQMMNTMIFLPRFTCLPASQSSLWRFTHLEVHTLISITHQTLNRVPHNQQKMRITQATSNLLEYLLALCRGRSRTPHNHHDRSQRQSPTSARRSSLLQAVQVAATTKSNKRITQRNTSTKCLQMQTLKQCTQILS